MSNDADDDPTLEVRALTLTDAVELMQIAGDECRELLRMQDEEEGASEELNPFELVSPETQAALLRILRAVAKRRLRPAPARLHGNVGGDSK